MSQVTLKINGKNVKADSHKSILQVCNDLDIRIPTLCYEPELNATGSCWVCAVKIEGMNGFVTACGTQIREGISVITDSKEVHDARKAALELLLSNHYADCDAPCKVACPGHVDVQTYVSLTANGQIKEALKAVKKNLPMPMSVGRICPAFCEAECRRKLVDEPVAIRQIKRYDGDIELNGNWCYVPEREADKGKHIAVVGAGPGGLTCGYFLTQKGYDVTVFEAENEPGGWLRYGIPEYRLPKHILAREIEIMCKNGMTIKTNTRLGKDIFLKELSDKYDAVYLGIGAFKAVPLRFDTKDLKGVYLGVDYLKDFAYGKRPELGNRSAIVGGGNTAIDCARTAKRQGADVTVLYRRTQKEMPAEEREIQDAADEGVKFEFLVNPVDIIGNNGWLNQILIEDMELGEADASGRRRPVPTGKKIWKKFDSLIAAVSQKTDMTWLEDHRNKLSDNMPLTKWNTVNADIQTMHWTENCFAGGDVRRGPASAIEAIADAKIAARSIDRFLRGEIMSVKPLFDSKKSEHTDDIDPEEYSQYKKKDRFLSDMADAKKRASTLEEVEKTFSDQDVQQEAKRCLECGCMVNTECKLRKYSTEYEADGNVYGGEITHHPIDDNHPFILRDPNKCIKCGRCIRTCAEVQGPAVLGYIYRGFSTLVGPDFGLPLQETACVTCGKCIDVCPTGALLPKTKFYKQNPTAFTDVNSRCVECGIGCKTRLRLSGKQLIRIDAKEGNSYNERELCYKGRFDWQNDEKIYDFDNLETALNLINKDNTVLCLTPELSLEEIEKAKQLSIKNGVDCRTINFQEDPSDKQPDCVANMRDIDNAARIVLIGNVNQVLKSKSRLAQIRGDCKIICINELNDHYNKYADQHLASLLDYSPHFSDNVNVVYIYSREEISPEDRSLLWKATNENPNMRIWVQSEYAGTRNLAGSGIEALNPAKDYKMYLVWGKQNVDIDGVVKRIVVAPAHRKTGTYTLDTGEIIKL